MTNAKLMIRRFGLFWTRFSPLETRLLIEIRKVLPSEAQPIFDEQVSAIRRVIRLPPSWGEIDFFTRNHWQGVTPFPCKDEFRLASVRFRVGSRSYKSVLTCISGHIFDFATTPGPKTVAFENWDGEPTTVLLNDPLRSTKGTREPEKLPSQWIDLLSRRAVKPAQSWDLHDENTAHRVVIGDAEFLILAERHGPEFILYRVEPPAEQFYHVKSHDGIPEPISEELETWLQ